MRILFVAHGFPPRETAGTERHVEALAQHARTRGHEVSVLAATRSAGRAPYERFVETIDGVDVFRIVNNIPARSLASGESDRAIDAAVQEMERRRVKQQAHNEEHGIEPRTVIKPVRELLEAPDGEEFEPKGRAAKARQKRRGAAGANGGGEDGRAAAPKFETRLELIRHVKLLRAEMMAAAKNLDFELAARIRDEVFRYEKMEMELL